MLVKIEKLDHFGRGITYINNKICFIENTLPGEIVRIKLKNEKQKFYIGKVEEYVEISKDRIQEECPYSIMCGGCQLNHMTYDLENKWKEEKVKEIIERYGKIDSNIIKPIQYQERDFYRNKITLHGSNKELGYYKNKTNDIIKIKKCLLVNNKINELLNELKVNDNIEELIIKSSNDEQEILIGIKGRITEIDKWKNIGDSIYLNNKCIFYV